MIAAMIIIKAITHGEFFIGKIYTGKASRWNIICVGGGQADFSRAEFVDPVSSNPARGGRGRELWQAIRPPNLTKNPAPLSSLK
jgi:hypothetical protein